MLNQSEISKIIRSSRDSDADLLKLAKAMDVRVDQLAFKQFFNKSVDYCILNMDGANGSGTHWMAVSNKHKLYFDPLDLPPPRVIPSDYKTAPFRIQNHLYGHCGDYCVLWMYYLQHRSAAEFYRLFTPLPDLL